MGRALVILKNHEEAVDAFNHLLELRPDETDILFEKGLALSQIKKPDSALEALTAASDSA